MPNRWTFTILPIKELLTNEVTEGIWIDAFAGFNSPATPEYTNDLNPKSPAKHHMDALEFLKGLESEFADGILHDPPYSITKAKRCYEDFGASRFTEVDVTNMSYWAKCKDEEARIIKRGGKAITFGWNSNGLGLKRGFQIEQILLIPHGGSKNDTIVTVEYKQSEGEIHPKTRMKDILEVFK